MAVHVLNRTARAFAWAVVGVWLVGLGSAQAARVKDIATIKGIRPNQVIGYGLIVGLNGSGDKNGVDFTAQSLASMLSKMGIAITPESIRVKNVAAVMVTSSLPPFTRTGSEIDVLISSVGDASSLEGGTLLMTPLFGTDGEVYAVAQGPISVGGFSAGGGGGSSVQKNHPTVGRIANGATVEREIAYAIDGKDTFQIALRRPDFMTATRAETAINERFGEGVAKAGDPGTLMIRVPDEFADNLIQFMSMVEALDVMPDNRARIILNERTGTVVMGETVRVSTVAVSHGSLSVTISATNQVSQPAPLSAGETVVVRNSDVTAIEEPGGLSLIGGFVSIGELVRGLNAMGVTPRDLIAILQAVKAAGALSADLEVM